MVSQYAFPCCGGNDLLLKTIHLQSPTLNSGTLTRALVCTALALRAVLEPLPNYLFRDRQQLTKAIDKLDLVLHQLSGVENFDR